MVKEPICPIHHRPMKWNVFAGWQCKYCNPCQAIRGKFKFHTK